MNKKNMNSFKLLAFAACCLSVEANAQIQVSAFNPSVTADGVNYMLPKTVVKTEVSAMKTVFVPGEYAKYAERYLHLSNARSEAETSWKVTGISVSEIGVPDTLKRYSVKSKDKNLLPKVQLSEDGVILAINKDIDTSVKKSAVGRSTNHKLDYKKYLNEEMLSATSTSKMAELVAAEILDIRDSKNQIRRGQVESMPKDGASLKIVLDQLDVQEEALTQLFIGYTDTVYSKKTYYTTPQEDIEKDIVFRFSKKLGFVDKDDLAGEPYYITVKDEHTVALPSEKDAAKRKIVGMVYNVPSQANVRVFNASKTFFEGNLPFAQFGTIDMLSATLFGKDVVTKVIYNPATGAVSKVE